MQQPIQRRDVYEPSLTATIGGREVELSSANVDRALPDPFERGTLTSASVAFTAVEGPDVVDTVATPWDPGTQWPPVPQSSASVDMDTGPGPVSLLGGGVVVSASGGTEGREIDVEAADRYESLNRTTSWNAVAANMPGLAEGSLGRYVSMNTTAITDEILRECGWYSTPPRPNFTILSVPAQGSLWPEVGSVTESGRQGGGYPYWAASDWGVGVVDVDATYSLTGSGSSLNSRLGLELAAVTQTSQQSTESPQMRIDVNLGTAGGLVRLTWSDTSAQLRFRMPGGTVETVASVSRQNGLLYASIDRRTNQSVVVTLRSGSNVVTTAPIPVAAAFTQGAMNTGRIWGTGRASGFIVAAPVKLGTLHTWTPNAVLYPRTSNRNSLDVRPSIEGENCAALLAEQCEAEGATYWIDETGVLRWWDLARLEARSSVATLTGDDDITGAGFTWRHDLSRVKSRVSVKWKETLSARSWRTTIDLMQGRGATLQPGDDLEDWINVPDDEVWLMPDIRPGVVGSAYTDYNYGIGSWYGAIVDRGDGVDTWAQLHGTLQLTIERVTDRAFKSRIRWTGSERATQKTPDAEGAAGTSLWRRRYDSDLPIIRGKEKWTLTDQFTYSVQNGPATAPEHEIDAGWWIQSASQAKYIADYAGARLTLPQPVLSSVALIPFPGLQLGDVVTVEDTSVTRLTVRGIVVEDSRDIGSDMGMSHAVTVRPTYVTRNGVTWQEWATAARPKTRAQWASNQNSTWSAWGENPLLKEDVI